MTFFFGNVERNTFHKYQIENCWWIVAKFCFHICANVFQLFTKQYIWSNSLMISWPNFQHVVHFIKCASVVFAVPSCLGYFYLHFGICIHFKNKCFFFVSSEFILPYSLTCWTDNCQGNPRNSLTLPFQWFTAQLNIFCKQHKKTQTAQNGEPLVHPRGTTYYPNAS